MTDTTNTAFAEFQTAFGNKDRSEREYLKLIQDICLKRTEYVDSTYCKSLLLNNIEVIWGHEHRDMLWKTLEQDIQEEGLFVTLWRVSETPSLYGPLRQDGWWWWRNDKFAWQMARKPYKVLMMQCAELGAFVFDHYSELVTGVAEQKSLLGELGRKLDAAKAQNTTSPAVQG